MGIALAASQGESEPASFAVQVPTPAQLALMRRLGVAPQDWMRPDWSVLTQLDHDNLVGVRNFGVWEDVPFIEFELIDGLPASALTTSLLPEEAIELVRQGAAGVSALHHASYVHAHLTPGSLLVTWDGRVKVMELGIAHTLDVHLQAASPGRPTGTPYFVAPERYDGRSLPASDVFSLGCILYQLMEGEVLLEKAAGRSQPLRSTRLEDFLTEARADRLDKRYAGLAEVLLRCVHHDPDQRYASAGALATALAGLLSGRTALESLRARMMQVREQPHGDAHEAIDELAPLDEQDLTQPGQSGSMAALASASGPPVWAKGASPERMGATVAPLLLDPSEGPVDHASRPPPAPAPSATPSKPVVVTAALSSAQPSSGSSGWKVGLAAVALLGLLGGGGSLAWRSLHGKHAARPPAPTPEVMAQVAPPAPTPAPEPPPAAVVAPTPAPAPVVTAPPPAAQPAPPSAHLGLPAPAPPPSPRASIVRDAPPPGPRAATASTSDAAPPSLGLASVSVASDEPPAPSPWIDAVAPLPWYTVDDLSRVRGVVGSPSGHGAEIDAMLADKGNSTFGPLRAAVSSSDSSTLTGFVSWLDGTNRLAPFLARARRGSGGAYGPSFSAAVAQVATTRFSAAQDAAGTDQGARCDAAEHVWVAMMVEDQRKLLRDWRAVCTSCASSGTSLQSCDPRRLAAVGGAP